jgi:hypothetical protein
MGQSFDGFFIDFYDGSFSGRFDLEDDVASEMHFDDVVCFVVMATVGESKIKSTAKGDVKRENTFKVEKVTPVDDAVVSAVMAAAEARPVSQVSPDQMNFNVDTGEVVVHEEKVSTSEDKVLSSFLYDGGQ